MARANLEDITRRELPDGCALRPYLPGDEDTWLQLHRRGDKHTVLTPSLFAEEFGDAPAELPRRQIYAVDAEGDAIGTVTAWLPEADLDPAIGRLHWLVVVPESQHKGVGSALIFAALERLKALGHQRAYLTSAAVRTEALRLYTAFGFQPVSRGELRPRPAGIGT